MYLGLLQLLLFIYGVVEVEIEVDIYPSFEDESGDEVVVEVYIHGDCQNS